MRIKGGDFDEAQRIIETWVAEDNTNKFLNLNALNLRSLPALPDNLKYLNICANKLSSLPTLPVELKVLMCSENRITSLPDLPDGLKLLEVTMNALTSLPELPSTLTVLGASYNPLRRISTLPARLHFLALYETSLPEVYAKLEDEQESEYIERIRKLQKTRKNITKNLKNHSTETKRSSFAMNLGTHRANPLHRFAMKNILNYLNAANLENININSLKPSNVEFHANKNAARKRLATRKKKYYQ